MLLITRKADARLGGPKERELSESPGWIDGWMDGWMGEWMAVWMREGSENIARGNGTPAGVSCQILQMLTNACKNNIWSETEQLQKAVAVLLELIRAQNLRHFQLRKTAVSPQLVYLLAFCMCINQSIRSLDLSYRIVSNCALPRCPVKSIIVSGLAGNGFFACLLLLT